MNFWNYEIMKLTVELWQKNELMDWTQSYSSYSATQWHDQNLKAWQLTSKKPRNHIVILPNWFLYCSTPVDRILPNWSRLLLTWNRYWEGLSSLCFSHTRYLNWIVFYSSGMHPSLLWIQPTAFHHTACTYDLKSAATAPTCLFPPIFGHSASCFTGWQASTSSSICSSSSLQTRTLILIKHI